MFKTQNQAVQTVTELLTAHGYDARQYDLLSITDEYHQETGNYDVLALPNVLWAAVFDNEEHKTSTPPPANFVARDWNDHPHIAPADRFEVYDGPAKGGVSTSYSPGWPVTVHVDNYGAPGEGVDISVDAAKRLLVDLQAVVDQLEDQ